jgi:serine O-acetyltransferase
MLKRFWEEVDSFFARDPAAHSRLEVVLCYPGLHAVLLYRLSHWLWQERWKVIARMVSQLGRFLTGIEIHPGATIGRRLFIDHGMGVVIGETARIGDDVTLYQMVTLGGVSPQDNQKGDLRHPQLGNHVIVGAGAQLLGAITIGEGARIGANAVVTRDVPAHATMAGIPARPVGASATEPFEAYGLVHGEVPDPMAEKLEGLLADVTALRAELATLKGEKPKAAPRTKKGEG